MIVSGLRNNSFALFTGGFIRDGEIRCALFSDLQTADGAAESLAEKRNLHPKVWDKQKNALYLHSEIVRFPQSRFRMLADRNTRHEPD